MQEPLRSLPKVLREGGGLHYKHSKFNIQLPVLRVTIISAAQSLTPHQLPQPFFSISPPPYLSPFTHPCTDVLCI